MVAVWTMQSRDARGDGQAHSGMNERQPPTGNGERADPREMYEAYAMASPCVGGQQCSWAMMFTVRQR